MDLSLIKTYGVSILLLILFCYCSYQHMQVDYYKGKSSDCQKQISVQNSAIDNLQAVATAEQIKDAELERKARQAYQKSAENTSLIMRADIKDDCAKAMAWGIQQAINNLGK